MKFIKSMSICFLIAVFFLTSVFQPTKTLASTLPNLKLNNIVEYTKTTSTESFYQINIKKGSSVTVFLGARLESGSLGLYLYDESDIGIGSVSVIYNDKQGIISFTAPRTANYKIKVSGNGIGKYKIAVFNGWMNPGSVDTQRDFNGTINTAKYISSGKRTIKYLNDYQRFIGKKGTTVSFDVTPLNINGSIGMKLMDAKGSTLDSHSVIYNNRKSSITYKIPYDGVYYFAVYGQNITYLLSYSGISNDKDSDGDLLYDSAEYFFGLDVLNKDTDGDKVSDFNELVSATDPKAAMDLNKNTLNNYTLSSAYSLSTFDKNFCIEKGIEKEQWFKFSLKQNESVSVVLRPNVYRGDMHIYLYDIGGKLINYTSSCIHNNEFGFLDIKSPSNAVYYIKVKEDSVSKTRGNYQLGIHHQWNSSGITDSNRTFSSTQSTAKYISPGIKHFNGDYGVQWYRFEAGEDSSISVNIVPSMSSGSAGITLYSDKGSTLKQQSVVYNGQSATLNYTTILSGVYYVKITGSLGDYNLSYSGVKSVVSYSGNGNTNGSVPVDGKVYSKGTNVAVLGNTGSLVKTGYTFSGWNTKSDGSGTNYAVGSKLIMGTTNITLYAKWVINKYTVNFNSNGGTTVLSQKVGYNSKLIKPSNPTKKGYSFVGWYIDAALTKVFNFDTQITENKTLYAKWVINKYAVTFNSNGGSKVPSQTVAYNSKLVKPANPVRKGYTFGGWYTDTLLTKTFNFNTLITGNTTLYAKWVIKK